MRAPDTLKLGFSGRAVRGGYTTVVRSDDLIFDVGMHVGNDTDFYLKKGFRVVAVEGNPEQCRLAEKRFVSYVNSGQLTIVDRAIASAPGEVAFYINDSWAEWATISRERADYYTRFGGTLRTIKVPAVRFADLLKAHGIPYYLKIDIEGGDIFCVEDLASFSARPKYVSVETSKTSFDELFEVLSLLWSLGYRRYKVVSQQWRRLWRCPHPAREGLYLDYRFAPASSGPFGDEAPGRWLDAEETVRRYLRIFRLYRMFGDESAWQRLAPWSQRARIKLVGWHDLHAVHEDSGAEV